MNFDSSPDKSDGDVSPQRKRSKSTIKDLKDSAEKLQQMTKGVPIESTPARAIRQKPTDWSSSRILNSNASVSHRIGQISQTTPIPLQSTPQPKQGSSHIAKIYHKSTDVSSILDSNASTSQSIPITSFVEPSLPSNSQIYGEHEDAAKFRELKQKFDELRADGEHSEEELHEVIQDLLEFAFKPNVEYAIPAMELVTQLPLRSYALKLARAFKREPSKSFARKFFNILGSYNRYPAIQKAMLKLMQKLSYWYRETGKYLCYIWFDNSPLKSMFLHIDNDEKLINEFLRSFNKVVKYRQEHPVPNEEPIITV